MKNDINLVPKKNKEELVKESRAYTIDLISAVVIIIVEVATFFVITTSKAVSNNEYKLRAEYRKDVTNLSKFNKTINTINNINQRYLNYDTIQKTFHNPVNVLTRFQKLVPSDITLSNFTYNYEGYISFNCLSTSVLSVAHLMQNFSTTNTNNKYFINTQITGVNITYNNSGTKTVQFRMSTEYKKS
ncbi:hypothetical protein M1145_00395 [Patescibacteria group bacterium]|nr:hypothetical protein [Patescibacteria group bacterium]